MSILRKLKEHLDENNVKYVKIHHSPAYTAQEVAESVHISGKELAKTVIFKHNGSFAMAVLPASYRIHLDYLNECIAEGEVELAKEEEFKGLFPDCEVGAMPPFGNLYDIPVYLASALAEHEEIAFNAGTHTDVIKMRYEDYEKLVNPMVRDFSVPED